MYFQDKYTKMLPNKVLKIHIRINLCCFHCGISRKDVFLYITIIFNSVRLGPKFTARRSIKFNFVTVFPGMPV